MDRIAAWYGYLNRGVLESFEQAGFVRPYPFVGNSERELGLALGNYVCRDVGVEAFPSEARWSRPGRLVDQAVLPHGVRYLVLVVAVLRGAAHLGKEAVRPIVALAV